MRRIVKGESPQELAVWMSRHPRGRYPDLTEVERQAIRRAAIAEQCGLCAYCCDRIVENSCHNEHVQAQATAPHNTLSFANIVASCNARNQCGDAHKSRDLPLTPFDEACETELVFCLTGRVRGVSQEAAATIEILGLNNRSLVSKRKTMVDALIYQFTPTPENLALLGDDQMLEMQVELRQTDGQGRLETFSPVLVNVINRLLSSG